MNDALKDSFAWDDSVKGFEGIRSYLRFSRIVDKNTLPLQDDLLVSRSGLIQAVENARNDPNVSTLLSRASVLIGEIVRSLVDRNARRIARSVASPENIEKLLPVLARLVDFVPVGDVRRGGTTRNGRK